MKAKYRPKTAREILGKLTEEAGEVLAAVGKTERWGFASANPELPVEERELNGDWIRRELKDLKEAIRLVEAMLGWYDYDDLDRFYDEDLGTVGRRGEPNPTARKIRL